MCPQEAFSAFGEMFFVAVTQGTTQRLKEHIDTVDPAYLASVNPAAYVAEVAAYFALTPIVIDVAQPTMSTREETVRAERFDIYSGRGRGDPYTRQTVTIHVPFKGDPAALRVPAHDPDHLSVPSLACRERAVL
jgi:hypothetical protein